MIFSVAQNVEYQYDWQLSEPVIRVMFSYVVCYLEEPVPEQYCEFTM